MRNTFLILLFMLGGLTCNTERKEKSDVANFEIEAETTFNKTKWGMKDGQDYPYRDQMLKDIVYNDTVRTLNKNEILVLFGVPDRTNDGYLYYVVRQTRLLTWPLHTKTMVIKLSEDDTIEWIKIHK